MTFFKKMNEKVHLFGVFFFNSLSFLSTFIHLLQNVEAEDNFKKNKNNRSHALNLPCAEKIFFFLEGEQARSHMGGCIVCVRAHIHTSHFIKPIMI